MTKRKRANKQTFRLRQLRTAAGLTQQELSDRTGIPRARISEYETERLNPLNMTTLSALKISEALDISIEQLFDTGKEPLQPVEKVHERPTCIRSPRS